MNCTEKYIQWKSHRRYYTCVLDSILCLCYSNAINRYVIFYILNWTVQCFLMSILNLLFDSSTTPFVCYNIFLNKKWHNGFIGDYLTLILYILCELEMWRGWKFPGFFYFYIFFFTALWFIWCKLKIVLKKLLYWLQ